LAEERSEHYIVDVLIQLGVFATFIVFGVCIWLIKRGRQTMTGDAEVLKALAGQCGVGFSDHIDESIDAEVIALLPKQIARKYRTIPLAREIEGPRARVKVAISDPLDVETVDALRIITKLDIEPVVVPKIEIRRALKRFYAR